MKTDESIAIIENGLIYKRENLEPVLQWINAKVNEECTPDV